MTPYSPDVARLHLLRVFCSDGRQGREPARRLPRRAEVPADRRQAVAAHLGLSETVFVDDAARGTIRIFTPSTEMEFAGHPTVGTAWLLATEREPVRCAPRTCRRAARAPGERPLARVAPSGAPFRSVRYDSPAEVEALGGPAAGDGNVGRCALADEAAGSVRARVFPSELGIAEDEATGLAAVQLCAQLGRPLDIRQGHGSRIAVVRPVTGSWRSAAAACVEHVRDHPVVVTTGTLAEERHSVESLLGDRRPAASRADPGPQPDVGPVDARVPRGRRGVVVFYNEAAGVLLGRRFEEAGQDAARGVEPRIRAVRRRRRADPLRASFR